MITHKITYNLTAILPLLPTSHGGKKRHVFNNFRPSFSFGSKQHFSDEISFPDIDELQAGNSATVKINLLPSRHISENLKSGVMFKIFEGEKVVGMGIINSIDNKSNT
ncbi:hypothetical protein [Parasediminibacterium sp. JCM 36343]|uniref:hypothetical protein n=1 Tax=Parasediminibacterium sp. JCM 36343 TaxID=3374279 RepID=UPI0039798E53